MMKALVLSLCLAAVHLAASPEPFAEKEVASPAEAGFHLTIAFFEEEGKPREWILVLNGRAYRDLAALEKGLAIIPEGSTIVWAPSDMKIGGEPLSTKEEVERLARACTAAGLSIRIIPAG